MSVTVSEAELPAGLARQGAGSKCEYVIVIMTTMMMMMMMMIMMLTMMMMMC